MATNWFISPQHRRGSKLILFTFLLAFVVILLGAYTRLTDAGLSCPDWPHCYGYLTAPHTTAQIDDATLRYPQTIVDVKKAWTEMTHRYFAGTEGLLILVLAFSMLLSRKVKQWKNYFISLGLIVLLCTQVLLGMLTVTEKLRPIIVLSHLLTALSILSLLWWAYLDLHLRVEFNFKKPLFAIIPWLWTALIIVFLQITLGGWVSTHYAGLACVDFPYCNGKLLPPLVWQQFNSDLITIHMVHRLGALITASYLGALAWFLLRQPAFRSIAFAVLMLIVLQVTLGILNIIWLRPIWIAICHQTVAILLLLTVITALVKSYHQSWNYKYDTWNT